MFKHFLILFLLIFSPFATSIIKDNPYKLMQEASYKTFNRLKNDQYIIRKNPDFLRNIVREELMPYIQIKYIGALILGSYYNDVTSLKRDAYFQAIQSYLEKIYGQILAMYNGQRYEISPEQSLEDKKNVVIRLTIIDPKRQLPIRLDFQWRKNSKTGYWQSYDIITEGISLITTKQNEWINILRLKGIDGLTKELINNAKIPIILYDKKS
ncbi:MAG: phospholipid-binding protein MlaC [Arsenophonus sp. ER-BJ3-MAG3]